MKKIAIALAVIAALAAGGFWMTRQKKTAKENNLQAANVFVGDISDVVDTTGEVSPLNRVEVKPSVSGRVDKLLVDEGDSVKAGQVLAWMSSNDRVAILDAARAKGPDEMKYWEDTYRATPILSPLSGTVILRNVVEGQTVSAADTLYALADKLIVVGNVDETDVGQVRNGQKTTIGLDAYPDTTVTGEVFQILSEGKNVNNVITYGVKIRLHKTPPFFRSQMTANIKIVVREKHGRLLLPSYAVQESTSGVTTVLVKTEGEHRPKTVPIQTGFDDGQNVEILSGLDAGATVYFRMSKYVPQQQATTSSPFMMGGQPAKKDQQGQTKRTSRQAARYMP